MGLAGGGGEAARPPRGPERAVDGVHGVVLGGERDRVAVAGGLGPHPAPGIGDGGLVVVGVGEDVEALVLRIVDHGFLAGPLGEAGGVAHRAPAEPARRLVSVRTAPPRRSSLSARRRRDRGGARRVDTSSWPVSRPAAARVDQSLAARRRAAPAGRVEALRARVPRPRPGRSPPRVGRGSTGGGAARSRRPSGGSHGPGWEDRARR